MTDTPTSPLKALSQIKKAPDMPDSFDRKDAMEFVSAICDGINEAQTWQTFTDDKVKKATYKDGRDPLARKIHGTFEEALPKLLSLQSQGAGVYLTINKTDLLGREAANIVSLRSAYIDMDDGSVPPNTWPVEPSIVIIRSDNKRWQAHWLLKDGENISEFVALQKRLIAYWKSDPAICYLNCVMRVPGFWHLKDVNNPKMYRLERCHTARQYTIADLVAGHPVDEALLQKKKTYEIDGNSGKIAGGKHEILKDAVARMRGHGFPVPVIYATLDSLRHHIVGTDDREVADEEIHRLAFEWGAGLEEGPVTLEAVAKGGEIKAGLEAGRKAQEKKKGLQIMGPEEWRGPMPKREWLVEGMLPVGGVGLICSAPGKGKSLLLVELAECIAAGKPFGGFTCRQGKVLYCAPDSPMSVQYRLRGIPAEAAANIYFAPTVAIPGDLATMLEEAQAGGWAVGFAAVIVDTYDSSRPHSNGGSAEQDAMVYRVVGAARAFSHHTGAVTIFSHHTTRGDEARPRGSQSFDGLCDMIGAVTQPTNMPGIVTLQCLKARDCEPFPVLSWDIATRPGMNPEDDSVPYLTPSAAQTLDQARKATEATANEDKILACRKLTPAPVPGGWTEEAIARFTLLHKSTVHRTIKKMKENGTYV